MGSGLRGTWTGKENVWDNYSEEFRDVRFSCQWESRTGSEIEKIRWRKNRYQLDFQKYVIRVEIVEVEVSWPFLWSQCKNCLVEDSRIRMKPFLHLYDYSLLRPLALHSCLRVYTVTISSALKDCLPSWYLLIILGLA